MMHGRFTIITAGVTGNLFTPSMCKSIPVAVDDIVKEILVCAENGAAAAHVCARTADGKPTLDVELYKEICAKVKEKSDIILNVSAVGIPGTTLDERLEVINSLRPEMCTVMGGTMGFDLSPFHDFVQRNGIELKGRWEEPFILDRNGLIRNSMADLEAICTAAKTAGTKLVFRICDSVMLSNLATLQRKGFIQGAPVLEFLGGFGMFNGMSPAGTEQLVALKLEAERLLGQCVWSACGYEAQQFNYAGAALTMGGNVTVGLENSFFCGPGMFADSSLVHVEKLCAMARLFEIQTATPAQAREIYGL